jgi:hypothetical protein
MKILDRLPVFDQHYELEVCGEPLKTRPFQIIVQVSIIAIYPEDGSSYPRLPLLGLRGIIKNNLKLVIDGKRNHVSLSSSAW